MDPPPHFVNLSTAFRTPDKSINVIGVCVDFLPACKTCGTDFGIKFTLHDPSWHDGLGLPFRFFHADLKKLPQIENNGDVLVLRNVKIKVYSGQLIGLSNSTTSWVVLPSNSVENSSCPRASDVTCIKSSMTGCPSPDELAYAKAIAAVQDRSRFPLPQKPTSLQVASIISSAGGRPPPKQDKFSLVQDLRLPTSDQNLSFVELLGEVRRIFAGDTRVELSLTDYTTNKNLYNYAYGCDEGGYDGDRFGYAAKSGDQWPGPWGQMTILVTLWDAHAQYAVRNVKEGQFVYLKNVQIKHDKQQGKLEGHCRGDKVYRSRVNISLVLPREADGDERMRDLLRRKREYEAKAKSQHQRFVRDASALKHKAPVTDEEDNGRKSKKSKNREKKNKKRQQVNGGNEKSTKPERTDTAKTLPSNTHVQCQNIEVKHKRIDDIMDANILKRTTPKHNKFDLPFQNCRYKAKVRVVDFFPHDIADFAAPYRESEYDMLSDHDSDMESEMETTQSGQGDVKWEWRFFLLVEDAATHGRKPTETAQMELLVAGTDGQFLLNLDPCDLRHNPAKLGMLREKLFVLWGDLEEQKEARKQTEVAVDLRPVGRPFDCFINEYGIPKKIEEGLDQPVIDYERMFRMNGARIM